MNEQQTFRVEIELVTTSQKIVVDAVNTYQKGDLFCVYDGVRAYKFPLRHIFRITEVYRPGEAGDA